MISNPDFVALGKYHVAEGTQVEFFFEWKGSVPGSTGTPPPRTTTLKTTASTPAPGFATTINASKFITAVGLALQSITLARLFIF